MTASCYLRRSIAFLLLASTAGSYCAASESSPWGVEFFAGDAVSMRGSLNMPFVTNLGDLGTLDPSLEGSALFRGKELHYDDILNPSYTVGTEVSYAPNSNLEGFARLSYSELNGESTEFGTLTITDADATVPVTAHVRDTDSMSLMLGTRYVFNANEAWQPFVGAAVGASRLQDLRAGLTAPNDAVTLNDVRLARATTMFAQSFEAGIGYSMASFDVRLAIDANHSNGPDSGQDATLKTIGFTRGGGESPWSFPVTLGAEYRF